MAEVGSRAAVAGVCAWVLLACIASSVRAGAEDEGLGPIAEPIDDGPLLPDGSPLPETSVHVSGEWENEDFRIISWDVDLAVEGDVFAGRITFPTLGVVFPLTVRGTRTGDIVEFSVRAQDSEVAYFAGHLAGTSLVGTFDGATGQQGEWVGSWFPETVEIAPGTDIDVLPVELAGPEVQ